MNIKIIFNILVLFSLLAACKGPGKYSSSPFGQVLPEGRRAVYNPNEPRQLSRAARQPRQQKYKKVANPRPAQIQHPAQQPGRKIYHLKDAFINPDNYFPTNHIKTEYGFFAQNEPVNAPAARAIDPIRDNPNIRYKVSEEYPLYDMVRSNAAASLQEGSWSPAGERAGISRQQENLTNLDKFAQKKNKAFLYDEDITTKGTNFAMPKQQKNLSFDVLEESAVEKAERKTVLSSVSKKILQDESLTFGFKDQKLVEAFTSERDIRSGRHNFSQFAPEKPEVTKLYKLLETQEEVDSFMQRELKKGRLDFGIASSELEKEKDGTVPTIGINKKK